VGASVRHITFMLLEVGNWRYGPRVTVCASVSHTARTKTSRAKIVFFIISWNREFKFSVSSLIAFTKI